MDKSADNIIMNSCQYTPVYFIENSSVNQVSFTCGYHSYLLLYKEIFNNIAIFREGPTLSLQIIKALSNP